MQPNRSAIRGSYTESPCTECQAISPLSYTRSNSETFPQTPLDFFDWEAYVSAASASATVGKVSNSGATPVSCSTLCTR